MSLCTGGSGGAGSGGAGPGGTGSGGTGFGALRSPETVIVPPYVSSYFISDASMAIIADLSVSSNITPSFFEMFEPEIRILFSFIFSFSSDVSSLEFPEPIVTYLRRSAVFGFVNSNS
jgi:hypothetical protein